MTQFTTRVELHSATYNDYESLHTAMEAEGFSRVIQSDSGKWYHLPTAEYDMSGSLNMNNVLELAKRAAAKTGRSASVLVTESNRRTWTNLPSA